MTRLSVLATAALVASAVGKTIPIDLTDIVFTPDLVTANQGDVLEFHFKPHKHSVVLGDVDRPCMPATSGGFSSGFITLAEGEYDSQTQVFRVTVNDTKPLFFYCSTQGHCQGGMVGAVNADNATLGTYKMRSRNVTMPVTPDGIFGGEFVANPNTSATYVPLPGAASTSMTGSAMTMTMTGTSSMTMSMPKATSTGSGGTTGASPSTGGSSRMVGNLGFDTLLAGLGGVAVALMTA